MSYFQQTIWTRKCIYHVHIEKAYMSIHVLNIAHKRSYIWGTKERHANICKNFSWRKIKNKTLIRAEVSTHLTSTRPYWTANRRKKTHALRFTGLSNERAFHNHRSHLKRIKLKIEMYTSLVISQIEWILTCFSSVNLSHCKYTTIRKTVHSFLSLFRHKI